MEKIHMCYVELTKYMLIKHFKIQWHFFLWSLIFWKNNHSKISNYFNKPIIISHYISYTLTTKTCTTFFFSLSFLSCSNFFLVFVFFIFMIFFLLMKKKNNVKLPSWNHHQPTLLNMLCVHLKFDELSY